MNRETKALITTTLAAATAGALVGGAVARKRAVGAVAGALAGALLGVAGSCLVIELAKEDAERKLAYRSRHQPYN